MKLRHLMIVFLPALLLVVLIFFIRVIQYEPLRAKPTVAESDGILSRPAIPIFPEDPIIGDKRAPATVIVFGDFGCENCKQEYLLFQELLKEYPKKIKMIWKGLPVSKFPFDTQKAQNYGFCAQEQNKFEAFAALVFANNTALNDELLKNIAQEIELDETPLAACLSAKTTSDYSQKIKDLARVLNIQTVPALFMGNIQIPAPQTLDEWKSILSL